MRRIRNYRMFPCAVPDCGAGHPRVTHPSAASATEVAFARLACLRRAASVRSEPGSNSPSSKPVAEATDTLLSSSFPSLAHEPASLHLFARIDRGSLASIPFPLSSPSLNAAKDRRPLSRCHDSLRLFHARCQVPSAPFPRSSDRRLRHRGCILHITSHRVKYLLKNC